MKKIIQLTLLTGILTTSIMQADTTMTVINTTDSDITVTMQSIYHKNKKNNPAARVARHDKKTITLNKAQTPFQQEVPAKTDKITGAVTPGHAEIKATLAADGKGQGEFTFNGCLQFIEVTDLGTKKTVKWHRNEKECFTPNTIRIQKRINPRNSRKERSIPSDLLLGIHGLTRPPYGFEFTLLD